MKAIAVFPGRREVKLIDHEEPKITTPTQVKLRTLEVGVCGTDKKITSFQFGTPPAGYDYFIIGHEMLGEVVEVGSGVRDFKPGDLAVTAVRHSCPHEYCRACRTGSQDFCFTGDFTEHGITLMKPGSLCGSADLCTKSMKHQDSRPTFILY